MSNAGKYSPMSKSRSLSRDDPNAESLMNATEQEAKISVSSIKSPKSLWKWFIHDPCSRWQVMFFLGIFCLSIVLLIVSIVDPSSSYVTSGVAGVIVAGYGAFHFKTLMALREEVDEFERHNSEFKRENAALRVEMDKLEKTREELQTTSVSLEETTKKNKENLVKFETISHNLEVMGQSNMEGMQHVAELTKGIAKKWKQELVQQEKDLYMDVFERLEMKDTSEQMTIDEYNDFLDVLPAKYRMRLQHQKSFAALAGDDNKVNYKEFSDVLDNMAHSFAKTPRAGASSGVNATLAISSNSAAAGGGGDSGVDTNTSRNGIIEEE